MIASYIGRSRLTGACFGGLIQEMGERHGYRESSVDVKYFTAELRVNGGKRPLRSDPVT